MNKKHILPVLLILIVTCLFITACPLPTGSGGTGGNGTSAGDETTPGDSDNRSTETFTFTTHNPKGGDDFLVNCWDIWGASANDIRVFAQYGNSYHWNGSTWDSEEDLNGTDNGTFFAAWGLYEGETLLWGNDGLYSSNGTETGTSEISISSPSGSIYPGSNYSIWAHDADNIYMNGYWGEVQYYDGSDWENQGDVVPGSWQIINGFWGPSASNLYGISDDGEVYVCSSGNWNATPMFDINGIGYDGIKLLDLNDIDGVSTDGTFAGSDVWICGEYGMVYRLRNGSTTSTYWDLNGSSNNDNLYAILVISSDDVWVAGDQGMIYHWDGTRWNEGQDPVDTMNNVIHQIWEGPDGTVWFVGEDGGIFSKAP